MTTRPIEKEFGSVAVAEPSGFDAIAEAIQRHMAAVHTSPPFVPGQTRIPLNVPTYGAAEVVEALESLMSGWVTMGKKVKQFEGMWADYIDVNHGVMTNSGSSANLLMLSAMVAAGRLRPGDEIITPALTWATTVFPIAQVGCVPVLVDVDLETYNISPEAVREAITAKTRAIMPVHLLGNPCDLAELLEIAVHHKLLLFEDACEAHGAEYHGRKVGCVGDAATFSFFFSHHISTIEGGMVVTDDAFVDVLRSMRAFGWVRELSDKKAVAAQHQDIDERFLFQYPGYNFRPTEIGGAFGIHQVPRLEGLIAHRRDNAAYWNRELAQYRNWLALPEERPHTRHVWFAYPVMVKRGAPFSRRELVDYLESQGLETRPIEAGNMAVQPAMTRIEYLAGPLPNAQYIHDNAFFFGNHQDIGLPEREAIAGYFHDFMRRYR